uniref:Uncharacterized protein n=1 Tax=Arundo donax TaxID=35708 RepID=A0A0A8Y4W4_ARUDO
MHEHTFTLFVSHYVPPTQRSCHAVAQSDMVCICRIITLEDEEAISSLSVFQVTVGSQCHLEPNVEVNIFAVHILSQLLLCLNHGLHPHHGHTMRVMKAINPWAMEG